MSEQLTERHAAERSAFEAGAAKALAALPMKKMAQRRALEQALERERTLMLERHAHERKVLSGNGAERSNSPAQDNVGGDSLAAIPGSETATPSFYSERKLSRKQLKKLAKQEKEYERELDRPPTEMTAQARELAQIQVVLGSRGLCIDQVEPDGHCLFRAIVRQLRPIILSNRFDRCFPEADAETRAMLTAWRRDQDELQQVWSLRAVLASFMRRRATEFLPFIANDEDQGLKDGTSASESEPVERLMRYCERLEKSACWGGQPELCAIALALACRVEVYGDPAVLPGGLLVMGRDATPTEQGNELPGVLRVSFHRQFFTLGEHYHAVVVSKDATAESVNASVKE